MITSNSNRSACDLFGGATAVRALLAGKICSGMRSSGLTASQLGESTNTSAKQIESSLENEGHKLTGDMAMSLMAPLGISIDDVLPLSMLTREQQEYWTDRFQEGEAGVLAQVPDGSGEISMDAMLKLFIRLQALGEI